MKRRSFFANITARARVAIPNRLAPLPLLAAALVVVTLAAAAFAPLFYSAEAQDGTVPTKPTGLSATATHDQVALSWDDPKDDSITGYVILRRNRDTDAKGEFTELVSDTGNADTTYSDGSVAAETRYTYRIKAINAHGSSERSRWFHIDTSAVPVPAEPTGLSAEVSHDQVVLTWDDPNDDSITGYLILRRNRDTDAEGEFTTLVADTGSAATDYTDDSVAAETPYTYRIKAINEHGVSERSRWLHIDTVAAPAPEPTPAPTLEPTLEPTPEPTPEPTSEPTPEPTPEPATEEADEPPAKPTGLSGVATYRTVTLTWDDPQDDSITGYMILRRNRDTAPAGEFNDPTKFTGTNDTTYTDDSVAAGTPYTYRIQAVNAHGVSERSRWFHVDIPLPPLPTMPTGLSATPSHNRVVLTWDDSNNDSITGYVILRRNRDTDAEGEFTNLVNDTGSADTTYTDASVVAETPYTYRIQAINAGGTGEWSLLVHVDTPAEPEPPASPTGMLSASTPDTVMLFWDDPQDDTITGYRILRRDQDNDPDGDFATIAQDTGSVETSYTDTTVEPERGYVYRVLAINPGGGGEPSRDVEANTAAIVAPPEPLRSLRAHVVSPLLENLAQTTFTASGRAVELNVGANDIAQQFTTGSNPAGYNLSGVKLDIIGLPNSPADVSVELWSATSGATPRPHARIATLTHSTRRFTTGVNTFNDPAGTRLAASTAYFLFASYVGTWNGDIGQLDLTITLATSADDGSAPGWSVGGRFKRTHNPQDAWVNVAAGSDPDVPMKFSILGSLPAPPAIQNVAEPAAGDLPATDATTGSIRVGGMVTGNIDSTDDIDWFATTLYAGHKYWIDVEGADTSQGALTDPSLNALHGYATDAPTVVAQVTDVSDDDSGEGRNAREIFELPTGFETGTYYIAVGSSNDATGTYRLRLRDAVQPHGAAKPVEASLEPGDTASGTFDQNSWYYFILDGLTPGRYTVSFNRGPIYTLYTGPMTRPDGRVLYVMVGQPRGRATVTFDVRPGFTQTRYVEIYVHGDAGDYNVSLDETRPALVVGGQAVHGNIRALDEGPAVDSTHFGIAMKFYPVELEAGERYRVEIKGKATGHGTLTTPMLAHIAAPDGSYAGCGRGQRQQRVRQRQPEHQRRRRGDC